MFWKLESLPCASSSALSAMTSHSASTHGRSLLAKSPSTCGVHQLLHARMTDADAHALVVVADMRADRAQAVVPRDAAADLHAHLGGRQFDLVVEHRDVAERASCRNASPRRPRGRTRSCRCRAAAAAPSRAPMRALGRDALEAPPPRRKAVPLGDRVHHHESDVVAVARVLGARIAEPDEQQHGSGTEGKAIPAMRRTAGTEARSRLTSSRAPLPRRSRRRTRRTGRSRRSVRRSLWRQPPPPQRLRPPPSFLRRSRTAARW